MLSILARGCPSWTPVKGWQDLGGCWTPPPAASWWTPRHITAAVILAILLAVALGVLILVVRDKITFRRDMRRTWRPS
jgi:hypothetical protein